MQHEETDVKTHKHTVLACLIAAVCRNGPSHGQGGSRRHLRWPNWLLPRPNGLLIPPDLGRSPLFRVCPAGSWEQLSFPRVLINPAPPCISYNKQSKLNRLVYEDSRQLGCTSRHLPPFSFKGNRRLEIWQQQNILGSNLVGWGSFDSEGTKLSMPSPHLCDSINRELI